MTRKSERVHRSKARKDDHVDSKNKREVNGLRVPIRPSAQTKLGAASTSIEGVVIPKPKVGRLRTVADWHRQVAKVYRAMRKGFLPKEDGTKLTYVANVGAQLAKYQEEIKELELLRRQLEAARDGQALIPVIEHDDPVEEGPRRELP